MKIVDEFPHLDGIKGGIAVNEREYMATTILEEAQPLTQVIYSNFKEVVEQGQYVFDMLWNRAIPAKMRIKEIEERVKREFRSEEHTSELQSRQYLVCRLLLEKKTNLSRTRLCL